MIFEPIARPYFKGPFDEKYFFDDIAHHIHQKAPQVLGEHISVQLEAIGLLEAMEKGETPCSLPFTFAEAR